MSKKKKRLALNQFTTISERHLAKLADEGITEILTLANINDHELKLMLDTTINKARAIIAQARASLPDFLVKTISDMEQEEEERYYLSSGVRSIDNLLGGKGFESGGISQIAGQFGAGKSQIAIALCVKAAVDGVVVVVDTEGTWKVSRLVQVAEEQGIEINSLKQNVRIIQPLSSDEQANSIRSFLEEEGTRMSAILRIKPEDRVKLLIIDSVTGLFRMEYPGRAVLAERQNHLAEYLKNLYVFARKNNAIVLVTNQVIHSPDIFNPGMKAVGGNVVGHACTVRMTLKKKRGLLRALEMVDAAHLPMGEALFLLTAKGIEEYADE